MAASFPLIDDLFHDYFQYRNLTSTSRIFDNEISKLPLEQYRADHMIEQLTLSIHQFDINTLIDYWTQIEQRLLSTLTIDSQQLINMLTKIRTNLYRCYLIHAVQSSRTDKINEFFERLIKTLQQSNEWTKDWFALPFIQNPEENVMFRIYFSKQWNELFWNSLQNFLSTAFFHMTSPKICSLEENKSQSATKSTSPSTIPINSSKTQSDSTIISKLREKFLPKTTQNKTIESQNKLSSFSTSPKSILAQPIQESTIGNQILLCIDDSEIPEETLLPTRPKSATII